MSEPWEGCCLPPPPLLSQDLPPQGEGGGRVRRTHFHSPSPTPSSTPSTATRSPATQCPLGQKEWRGLRRNWAGGKGRTKGGNRTGQTSLTENSAERRRRRRKGKKGKNHLWLLEAPVRKTILQMHTPARTSQCWSRQTPAWTRSVHLDAPGQWHGQQPVSGTADPRSSQTGQVGWHKASVSDCLPLAAPIGLSRCSS